MIVLILGLCELLIRFQVAPYVHASSFSQAAGASIQRGVFASAPACGGSQFVYSATDAALQGYCDGVSHLDWKYKGITVTPTVIADFPTWFNQGGASVVTFPGSWALVATTGASDNWRGRYKTPPATPYSVVVCMEGLGSEHTFGGYGMFWTDGTQLIAFAYSNQLGSAAPVLVINSYSNATTFASTQVQGGFGITGSGHFCMAMVDDGTNRTEKYSFDKKNWIQIHTALRTFFLTATGVGVVIDDAATTLPTEVQIVSVETLASAL
jgi:hypothetical protein